jgi:hypothetical protein
MNHLFSKHISEIGQQKEPIKKFAKGNVVPQKRTSIDQSATLFSQGTIGAGRDDFWIINVDKNGTNRWKPLGLKSEFADLKDNSLWVFDGVGEIKFCLNQRFEYDTSFIENFFLVIENNLSNLEVQIDLKGIFGIRKIGFEKRNANDVFNYITNQIYQNEKALTESKLIEFLDSFMPSQTENKIPITSKLNSFLTSIAEIINLGFSLQSKIYKDTFSAVNLSTIDSAYFNLLSLSQNQTQSTSNNLLTPAEQIEEYRLKFRASQIIDDLPPFIKGQALNEQIAQGNVSNANENLGGAFSWNNTLQGIDVWRNISSGKWDDVTLKAFAPNLEDLLSPPPKYLNVMAQIEAYRKKFIANPIIDNLPPLIKGIAINEQVKQGNLRNEYLRLDIDRFNGNFNWDATDFDEVVWENIANGDWDDPTLIAFAPNMEDLLSPPPQYMPQNITTNFGLNIGDKLPANIINDWSKLAENYVLNKDSKNWRKGNGLFEGDREIEGFEIIDGQLGFKVSGTDFVYLKAEGFKDFMNKQLGLTTTPQSEPTLINQAEPQLINQEERIFSDEELQKLIQDKNFKLNDFEKIRILVSSPIRSENFQNLIFILGGMWYGGKKEASLLNKEALFVEYGKLSFGDKNTFLRGVDYKELKYEEIFSSLLFSTKQQIETIEPLIVEEPKMDITIDINSLEDEYNDVMFLIDVTPKVDVVAITELKQRAYDLKKQINAKHLERTDVMLQGNNIFSKLFESSSVQPIYRYDITPDPNAFAPDGTPTKLPKSIYELCQTPDFINWFGDYRSAYNYRNSPFSEVPCSVVKTEHFEPMIVFHGTGSEFSYFDFEKFPAMYFAQNFSYAEWFAEQKGSSQGTIGYVYPFLLNIRNYLDLTDFGINEISYDEFADAIFLQTGLEPDELKISQALIQDKRKVWAWVYLRNSPEFLKMLRDLKLFDGIIYYEQNPPINPTAPNYMTKGFIIFEPQNAKIVAPNRKELLLPSMRSFYLKKGGKL